MEGTKEMAKKISPVETRSPIVEELIQENVGKFMTRTVTHYHIGIATEIKGSFLKFERASWIAETGAFGKTCAEGALKEFENFKYPVWVNIKSIVDFTDYPFDLQYDKSFGKGESYTIPKNTPIPITGRNPFEDFLGEQVLTRTVTHYHVGRVKEVRNMFVVLEDATWIADTGPFGKTCANGEIKEFENFKYPVRVNLDAIVDFCAWPFTLPVLNKKSK